MSAFTIADFQEKNRKWFAGDAFLMDTQGVLTHGDYVARVAGAAQYLRVGGTGSGRIVAKGVSGRECALLYGLADVQGHGIIVCSPQLEGSQWRSLLKAVRPALVAVASEAQRETRGVLRELPDPYRELQDGGMLLPSDGVHLYAVTRGGTEQGVAPGGPDVFVEQDGAVVRLVAMTADDLMDAVRAVCAELALNHHDRCLWALATDSLLGRLAMACVFFRGSAGIERGSSGAVLPAQPTVVFTDGNEEAVAMEGWFTDAREQPKVFRLLSGAEMVAGARVSADLSSATLAAVGCPLPTFRLFARDAAGPEAPDGAVVATPLLGVEVKLVDGSGAETPAGGTGRLLVRARFAPRVALAADAGLAVAALASGTTDNGFVRTGFLARWAEPGRMWLWPDPGDGNPAQGGGRP